MKLLLFFHIFLSITAWYYDITHIGKRKLLKLKFILVKKLREIRYVALCFITGANGKKNHLTTSLYSSCCIDKQRKIVKIIKILLKISENVISLGVHVYKLDFHLIRKEINKLN